MKSIRWLGSPMCSAASPTSHRADFPNCCHGIGNIRTCGWPLELWRPSPTSSRSGVLPRSWAAMKTCCGSCPTSSSPKTGSCGFTISMALKPPPSPTMASRLFAKLSRIRSIAPVNLQTSVPRCSAYAYDALDPLVVDYPARLAQQPCDLAIAVAAVLLGKLDNIGRQTLLVLTAARDLALRRAMLSERRAGATLGDMQLRSHLLNAGTATRGA